MAQRWVPNTDHKLILLCGGERAIFKCWDR